jgi:hypothetical protein
VDAQCVKLDPRLSCEEPSMCPLQVAVIIFFDNILSYLCPFSEGSEVENERKKMAAINKCCVGCSVF